MWSKGELTEDHLRGYSKEYFQLVKAVPSMVESAMKKSSKAADRRSIGRNLKEETDHVELWIRFCRSLGLGTNELGSYRGLEGTNRAVARLDSEALSFEEAVASLYAYELELPKISATKIDGLKKFYGLKSRDALVYFETHEKADVAHAAVWRRILEGIRGERKKELAYSAAVRSLEAQNELLDSVMGGYVN